MDLQFDTYAYFGLLENPFLPQALRPDLQGVRLLIGRDDEVDKVARSLHKAGKITCLDGHVGVGKTSLVNVAAFKCYQAFLAGTTQQLLLPVSDPFQLSKEGDEDTFCEVVFRRVAQTLMSHRADLEGLDQLPTGVASLDAWMNSPIVEHINGAMGLTAGIGSPNAATLSATAGTSSARQLNTSAGFSAQGFEELVKRWLREIFGERGHGGVVCIIDNLELLETGVQAKHTLEALRDRLFNVPGLRWVFCGANGVIPCLAASERLSAYLNSPIIDVAHIRPSHLQPLFEARLQEFAMDTADGAWEQLPITLDDLESLYLIVNYNLRELFAKADEYCESIRDKNIAIQDEDHKRSRFKKWLDKATNEKYQVLKTRLPGDAFVILDLVMADEFQGTFGVGNFEALNQNSRVTISERTFKQRLKDMQKAGLITKNVDDESGAKRDGFSRDVYTVTATGAFVHYARLAKNENQGIKQLNWLRRVYN
jgi:hypothetical protein